MADDTKHGKHWPHEHAPILRDDQQLQETTRPGHYLVRQRRVVPIAKPAAGVDWIATVPATVQWSIQSMQAQLLTSAAVANRVPHIVLTDNEGHQLYNVAAPSNQVAASTVQYSAAPDSIISSFDNAVVLMVPLPARLLHGWSIRAVTTALDAADQWSNIFLLVKEWQEF